MHAHASLAPTTSIGVGRVQKETTLLLLPPMVMLPTDGACHPSLLHVACCLQVLHLCAVVAPNHDTTFSMSIVWTAIQLLCSSFFLNFSQVSPGPSNGRCCLWLQTNAACCAHYRVTRCCLQQQSRNLHLGCNLCCTCRPFILLRLYSQWAHLCSFHNVDVLKSAAA